MCLHCQVALLEEKLSKAEALNLSTKELLNEATEGACPLLFLCVGSSWHTTCTDRDWTGAGV